MMATVTKTLLAILFLASVAVTAFGVLQIIDSGMPAAHLLEVVVLLIQIALCTVSSAAATVFIRTAIAMENVRDIGGVDIMKWFKSGSFAVVLLLVSMFGWLVWPSPVVLY